MKFSIFENVRSAKGEECTYEKFLDITRSKWLSKVCDDIAIESDDDKRGQLKKKLPIITWQAFFSGKRVAKEAVPSGLYMLDIDHLENPFKLYSERMCNVNWKMDHGVVFVAKTASGHGLRVVALCRSEFKTIEECQKWLASEIGVEYDAVCKDWARSSFVTPADYTYYMNAAAIWNDNDGCVKYDINEAAQPNVEMEEALFNDNFNYGDSQPKEEKTEIDQREGLFGGEDNYKGVPLAKIAQEWLENTGGIPEKGERNSRLYKLATRMRYITDFNAATMLKVMPNCGLPESEMKGLIHSALQTPRAADMPRDLRDVLQNIDTRMKLQDGDTGDMYEIITDTETLPPMPPIIRQFVEAAPDDFKKAVALCQLPILGALGSKLRSKYLDGKEHSPSFLVSLEAPQASGKSFMGMLVETELAQMLEHDEAEREKEREYDNKVKEMKLLNIKVNKDNKDEVLGSRPKSLIRFVPATMSITKLLLRMNDAKGLHLFAFAPEIDTVTKTFKRGFSSYSDLLRVAFDNDLYGQDYASENSFSGIIPIYYNMLSSGTPKAMRRFYPDVEDGLVSRVCFVTLPDQFGKKMPVWKELSPDQKRIVDIALVRLNEVSIQGEEVQDDHWMKLEFLNKEMQKWITAQQSEAVKVNDRTRDIFCRRAAVVGFRAGMLAWFLYNEKGTPTIRKNVVRFAVWVANCMLNQHLLRFNISTTHSNTNPFEDVFNQLKDEFTREDVEKAVQQSGIDTNTRNVLYKWRLGGLIEETEKGESGRGHRCGVKFKKLK